MGKLTGDQVDWACQKREAGWSTQRIAMRLGVSCGAINYQCLKHGAYSPRQRRHETPANSRSYVGRDGRVFRTFTPGDDEQMLGLARQGRTISQIATAMKRGRTSVAMRIMLLELREELPS